jgi:GPH family glycoside/pentoside/hexuronide:cation symporter
MKKKLPLSLQVVYGAGVSYAIFDQIFAQWVLTYYLPPESFSFSPFLSPIFIILALVISRFVDVISDPLVGYWSDRVSTRWGRRIPFIFIGILPLALCTIAFFYPPRATEIITFTYLAVVGSLFFIFYTFVGAPYNALIPELSKTREDRLNLSTWQAIFRLFYTAIAMILPGVLIVVLGKGDDERGLRLMIIILSLFAIIWLYLMCFFIDERKYSGGKTSNANLRESLKTAFRGRAFVYYLFGFLFFFTGFNILRVSVNYYVTDIMGKGPASITVASALLFGVSALCFIPVKIAASKFGYRRLMLIFLIMLAFFSLCLFSLDRIIPVGFGFLILALCGIPVSGAAFIFPPAMLSEIASDVSDETGKQIEGILFGIQGFFLKLAFLVSIAILPIVLVSGGEQSFVEMLTTVPESPERAGIYNTALFAFAFFMISAFFYYMYPEKIPSKNKLPEEKDER